MNEPLTKTAPAAASELKLRIGSALVLVAVVLTLTWLGGWPFRVVWTLVAGLVAYEWLSIVGGRNAIVGGFCVVLSGLLLGFSQASQPALAGVAAAFALTGAILTPLVRRPLALEVCGVFYALVFALVTPALRSVPDIGLALILWSFAVVWFTDIAAYFTGRTLGGPKLIPRFSPKKTWSGALGGALAGTLGGYAVWAATPRASAMIGVGLVLTVSLLASIASQAGDFFESALKRRFGAKDSSHLIPGHGGFLDRLDGYWAALVLAGLLLFLAHL